MKALILVADGVEDLEFFYPFYRLREQDIAVDVAGLQPGTVTGKHGYAIATNIPLAGTKREDYDLVILPGGKAPERLRNHPAVVDLVKGCMAEGKVVASICHGAQILISAKVLGGRKATCVKAIKDDVIAAGAEYADEPVVVDGNLITSRTPDDLPYFCREIFRAIQAGVTR
jgi:protease I